MWNRTPCLSAALASLATVALLLGAPATAGAEELERTLAAREGGRLRVDLPGGHIEIDTHDEPTIELDGFASGPFDFQVEERDDEIIVRGRHEGWLPFFLGRAELHARVPSVFSLELTTQGGHIDVQDVTGDVEAETSGGSIELQKIRGRVQADTSGGRIQAQEIDGDFMGRTSGGVIHVSEVTGSVFVETSGGGIRVREAGGEVRARTSGGPIEVRFEGVPQGNLRTSGGSIEIEVPEGAGFELDAKTSGGRVSIDEELTFSGELDRSEVRGRIGAGGPHLDVETSGGSIRIRKR